MAALVERILAIVLQMLGILSSVRDLLGGVDSELDGVARETEPFFIQTLLGNVWAYVSDADHGLHAIHADLATVSTNVDTIIASLNLLSEQVGTPAQSDVAPSWWEPPGGGATPEDIAAAVWAYESGIALIYDETTFQTMGDLLSFKGALLQGQAGWWGEAYPGNPYFRVVYGEEYKYGTVWHSWQDWSQTGDIPIPDFANVQANDTALSFCLREANTENWQTTGPGGRDWGGSVAWAPAVFTQEKQWFRSAFTTADLRALYAQLHPDVEVPTPIAPPVWPGLDGATVGDSVALADGLVVDGPLDGLLVQITGTPAQSYQYPFGDTASYRWVGAVIFRSDRGDFEWFEPIGLDHQVITPKTMAHADSATFRVTGAWTGTVRPFTVNT